MISDVPLSYLVLILLSKYTDDDDSVLELYEAIFRCIIGAFFRHKKNILI